MHSFFITGTDTDAGKTLIATALLAKAQQAGLRTLGFKPVAAGGRMFADTFQNDDAVLLREQSTVSLPYEQVNPILLREPIAPHIAADREGRRLSVDRIVGFYRGAVMGLGSHAKPELCVIEGAGGWRVPLNGQQTVADIAKALQVPVILVVGMKLGCLNHALLTAEAIARDGLSMAGWVASQVDADMAMVEENLATLKQLLRAPCLGAVPALTSATALDAAAYLDLAPLCLVDDEEPAGKK